MINVTWLTSHGEMGPDVFHWSPIVLIRNEIRAGSLIEIAKSRVFDINKHFNGIGHVLLLYTIY